uniref:Uncharacterized protein n=1 Tax=Arundo donax TaxID=35708 RepID=A0A0A9BV51_ARUDO
MLLPPHCEIERWLSISRIYHINMYMHGHPIHQLSPTKWLLPEIRFKSIASPKSCSKHLMYF